MRMRSSDTAALEARAKRATDRTCAALGESHPSWSQGAAETPKLGHKSGRPSGGQYSKLGHQVAPQWAFMTSDSDQAMGHNSGHKTRLGCQAGPPQGAVNPNSDPELGHSGGQDRTSTSSWAQAAVKALNAAPQGPRADQGLGFAYVPNWNEEAPKTPNLDTAARLANRPNREKVDYRNIGKSQEHCMFPEPEKWLHAWSGDWYP